MPSSPEIEMFRMFIINTPETDDNTVRCVIVSSMLLRIGIRYWHTYLNNMRSWSNDSMDSWLKT